MPRDDGERGMQGAMLDLRARIMAIVLHPLAARNVCSMWKFESCIWESIIHGE